jgi:hypothetical protein
MDVRMRNLLPIIIPVMLLGACDSQEPARRGSSSPAADAQPSGSSTPDTGKGTDAHWLLQPGAGSTTRPAVDNRQADPVPNLPYGEKPAANQRARLHADWQ